MNLYAHIYMIDAEQADYDGKNLLFSGSQGSITSLKDFGKGPLCFSANEMRWEKEANRLHLEGASQVRIEQQFSLSSETIDIQMKKEKMERVQTATDTWVDFYPFAFLHSQGMFVLDAIEKAITSSRPLQYMDERICVEAESGVLFYEEPFRPERLVLQGNVQLHSLDKASFALADRMTYYPESRTVVLVSTFPKRVLFWQDSFRLSAPEVHIRRDPLTQEEEVNGIGEIRCLFTLEEEEQAKTIYDAFKGKSAR